MIPIQAAIYARVSSEQQAEAGTIQSQIAALRERVEKDGLMLSEEMLFVDEGYSGAHLIRPGLERLRDEAAAGSFDRLYVHSPDRLARKYAYQVLLVEEFRRAGVEVVFLNRELGHSPEDDLLLQVQGMIAEYERAKILERSRRGKRHAARAGTVAVLSGAPYGYHYVSKQAGNGQAHYEVVPEEAQVVQQIFQWVGLEGCSIGEVCRRLEQAGVHTRSGKTTWDRSVVWGMLKNPAYKGQAAFGKTRVEPFRPPLRPPRGHATHPKRAVSVSDTTEQEWLWIPVPPLVEDALFEAVQGRLQDNRQRARQSKRGARYLLQGLLVCGQCHYAYYGKAISRSAAKGHLRDYAYYRCIGTDAYRFGGERICDNLQARTDKLDQCVWEEVRAVLLDPHRLEQEHLRRSKMPATNQTLETLQTQITKKRRATGRLVDTYTEGYIDKQEFEPRMQRLRQQLAELETQAQQLIDEQTQLAELQLAITRLEKFSAQVKDGLGETDWEMKRDLIQTLVKRVEIGPKDVTIFFRITPDPFDANLDQGSNRPDRGSLQHCWRRLISALGCAGIGWVVLPVLHIAGSQELLYQMQKPFIRDAFAQYPQQRFMAEIVERSHNLIPSPTTHRKIS
jgi:site-specific DNA recombinase